MPNEAVGEDTKVVKVQTDGIVVLEGGETATVNVVGRAVEVRSICRKCVLDWGEAARQPGFQ